MYTLYAEAKIGKNWRGINFFNESGNGKKIVPIISGKSYVGEALDELNPWTISKDELSDEVKEAEKWLFAKEPGSEEDIWFGSCVSQFSGQDIANYDLSKRRKAGFVEKNEIFAYERGDTDWLEESVTPKQYAAMPKEARQAYQYYEWSQSASADEAIQTIRDRFLERINAFNELYLKDEDTSEYIEITPADCRVVVIMD